LTAPHHWRVRATEAERSRVDEIDRLIDALKVERRRIVSRTRTRTNLWVKKWLPVVPSESPPT
jgi:hypothetical protein